MAHVDTCMSSMPVFSALQRIAGEIGRCGYPDCRARNAYLCAKVAEALAVVLDRYTCEQGSASILRAVPADRPRLLRARTLLENRYGGAWEVAALTRAVDLNEKRLQAGFQALYGCTVHECLTRIRLYVALAMLASGFSVTYTAQAVGFANISHFSKVFRQNIGMPPKQWAHGRQAAK